MSISLQSIAKRYRPLSWLVFCAISSFFVACESDDDPPARIVIVHGASSFVVESGEQTVQTIGVKVLTRDSLPKAGVKVYFKVKEGKATFVDSVAVSDADGIASVTVMPGTQAGMVQITAQAEPLLEYPVFFTFQVTSGAPATMEVFSGNNQEVLGNTRLAKSLTVIVKDKFGNPVPSGEVTFSIASGNGALTNSMAPVYNGTASVEFTTGTGPQITKVKAAMSDEIKTEFTVFTLLPVQVSVVNNARKNIQVTWTKSPSPNFRSYSVYRSRQGFQDGVKLTEITDVNVTTFEDTQTNLGMVYAYYVRVDTNLGDQIESLSASGESGNLITLPSVYDADMAVDTENGLIYLTGGYSTKIFIISAATFQKIDSIMVDNFPYRIALSNDFSKLYVVYSGEQSFEVFQTGTKAHLKTVNASSNLNAAITDVYVAKNNAIFVAGDWLLKIDESNNYAQQKVGNTKTPIFGAFRFVGDHDNFLYVEESNHSPNSLYKLDMSQPGVPQVLEDEHASVRGTRDGVLSPDGTKIYLTDQVVNTSNFTVAATFAETSHARALSADGQKLYTTTFKTFATGSLKTVNASTLATERERVVGFLGSRMFTYNNALYVLTELEWPASTWRFYKIDMTE